MLQSQPPAEFHAPVFEKLDSLASGSGHFGNNLLPLVHELNQVIEETQIIVLAGQRQESKGDGKIIRSAQREFGGKRQHSAVSGELML